MLILFLLVNATPFNHTFCHFECQEFFFTDGGFYLKPEFATDHESSSQMNRMLLQHESECQPDEVRCPPERTVMDQVRQFSSPDGRGSSIHPQLGTKMLGLKLRPPIRLPDPDQTHVFSSSMSFPPSQYSYRDLQGYGPHESLKKLQFCNYVQGETFSWSFDLY